MVGPEFFLEHDIGDGERDVEAEHRRSSPPVFISMMMFASPMSSRTATLHAPFLLKFRERHAQWFGGLAFADQILSKPPVYKLIEKLRTLGGVLFARLSLVPAARTEEFAHLDVMHIRQDSQILGAMHAALHAQGIRFLEHFQLAGLQPNALFARLLATFVRGQLGDDRVPGTRISSCH